ncbi:MAG: phosphopantothenoylcysteine decarboxylase, partial [Planctomycetes bacterium]|nr:phosphopantothenoylcysteine decarboxylase [Planctomycetota bacterium]
PIKLHLIETPDVVALLGTIKTTQWMVAFALETQDHRIRALQKLERKSCDLIVVNGPGAMHAVDTSVEILDRRGNVLAAPSGSKTQVAREIFEVIGRKLVPGGAESPKS